MNDGDAKEIMLTAGRMQPGAPLGYICAPYIPLAVVDSTRWLSFATSAIGSSKVSLGALLERRYVEDILRRQGVEP